MNGYNFTERIRRVLAVAREEAARLGHQNVDTEHILLALIKDGEGVGFVVLTKLGVPHVELAQRLEAAAKPNPRGAPSGPDLPYLPGAKKVLELAMDEATSLNHTYIGTEHLLLGLVREEKGLAAKFLAEAGVTAESARAETLKLIGDSKGPSEITRIRHRFRDERKSGAEGPRKGRVLEAEDVAVPGPVVVEGVMIVLDRGPHGLSAHRFASVVLATEFLSRLSASE
jgi:ATP-dependent Clp protease ATP-binding subunit ClpA